jgi:hypothetical protein
MSASRHSGFWLLTPLCCFRALVSLRARADWPSPGHERPGFHARFPVKAVVSSVGTRRSGERVLCCGQQLRRFELVTLLHISKCNKTTGTVLFPAPLAYDASVSISDV